MRLLFLILLFLPVSNCKVNPAQGNDISKLIYEISSRGYYRYIEISKNQIRVWNNREMDNPLSGEVGLGTWQSLVSYLNGLDLEQFQSIKTSTAESAMDRSFIGELTVFAHDKSYTSPMFDHNTPPDQLKGLISQIMALAETVE